MPTKPGNGGHGQEQYDSETGRYVSGGSSSNENSVLKGILSTMGLNEDDAVEVQLREKYGLTEEDIKQQREIDNIEKENKDSIQVSPEAKSEADTKCNFLKKAEPQITSDITSVCNELGGMMFGLDFRLKTPKSMARRLFTDVRNGDADSIEEASKNVKDGIRYTMITSPDNFVEFTNKAIETLEKRGYRLGALRNKFVDDNGNISSGYKDINMIFLDKNGVPFELQCNIPDGACAKEGMKFENGKFVKREDGIKSSHFYYEESRQMTEKQRDSVRGRYLAYMTDLIWSRVPIPKNIKNLRR